MAFDYPGHRRPIAVARRWIIASIAVFSLIVAVRVLDWAVGTELSESLNAVLPDKLKAALGQPITQSLLSATVLGFPLIFTSPVKALEFHLFPLFDDRTLKPIGRATGLLVWHLPADGPLRTAWDGLLAWAVDGLHDGRWRLAWVVSGQPKLQNSFRYALLLGANGVGKSQLTREVARHLGRRDRLGDAIMVPSAEQASRGRERGSRRLGTWFRRVWLWASRAPGDPWDAGEIGIRTGDWEKRLAEWLPSAPTLLILDDPGGRVAGKAIALLNERQGSFWYPVRLVIVDQFVPPGLKLHATYAGGGNDYLDEAERPIPIFVLGDLRWSGLAFRAAVSKGIWEREVETGRPIIRPTGALRSLWAEAELDELCTALDGNPFLLAEATHWLAKSERRTAAALLRIEHLDEIERDIFGDKSGAALKALIAHRVLGERAGELLHNHLAYERQANRTGHPVIEAIASAAIAGGIPAAHAPTLRATNSTSEMRLLLPLADAQLQVVPAPGAWPISEAYVGFAIREFPELKLPDLILGAYRANPHGVLKALGRPGWLATEIAKTLDALPEQAAEPTLALDLFAGAAIRATWISRQGVPAALRHLDALPVESLPEAFDRITSLGSAQAQSVPDLIVSLLLLLSLGARRFRAPVVADPVWERYLAVLERWLRRLPPDLTYVPESLTLPMASSFHGLCVAFVETLEGLNRLSELAAVVEDFDHRIVRRLSSRLELDLASLPDDQAAPSNAGTAEAAQIAKLLSGYRRLWRIRSLYFRLDAEKMREIEMLAADVAELPSDEKDDGPAEIPLRLLSLRIVVMIARARSRLPEERGRTEAAAVLADAIAAPFTNNPEIQCQRAEAWNWVSDARSSIPEERLLAEAAARLVDAIAVPFPDDANIQRQRAEAWRNVTNARSETPEEWMRTEDAARLIDMIASPFADDADIQRQRAAAWGNVSYARTKVQETWMQVEVAARLVDEIASPFADYVEIQRSRALAWANVSYARSKMPGERRRTEAAARRVDVIAAPFRKYVAIQHERARAWRNVAYACSEIPVERSRAEVAARLVDVIAMPFADDAEIQFQRANAWKHVTYARSQVPEEREWTEAAARLVNAIAAPFPDDTGIRLALAEAWKHVTYACCKTPEERVRTEEIARLVGEIVAPFPDHAGMRLALAQAWKHVAYARSEMPGERSRTEEAAQLIDVIAAPFSSHAEIQLARAQAWKHVAYARSLTPLERARTEEAARLVDAIAAPFSGHAEIQLARDEAWRNVPKRFT